MPTTGWSTWPRTWAKRPLRQVRQAWAERLPSDPEALFADLLALPQQELLTLLAVCVGFTVTAIASREDEVTAAALARAVGLDMHAWWTPTASGYFEHVSKAKALEGVQALAPTEVNRLAKLKKSEICSEAERLAMGSSWLPAMFRVPEDRAMGAGDLRVEASADEQPRELA